MTRGKVRLATGIVFRLAWLGACVLLLATGLTTLQHPNDPNNLYGIVIFHGGMRVLTFPLGVLAWYVIYGLLSLMRGSAGALENPDVQIWVVWVVLVSVGYLQWFRLVPLLVDNFWTSRKRARLGLHD